MNSAQVLLDGRAVSCETMERLEIYAALLTKWTARINLVAPSTVADLWDRHILDSVQVYDAKPEGAAHWADLGSGGGLPGCVVAILAAEQDPDLRITLVESDQRKATFLRTVSRELGLTFAVKTQRIEELEPLGADVISARALTRLDRLLEFCERHMTPDGTALFLKGDSYPEEVRQALERWTFAVQKIPSRTHAGSAILKIGDIARA